MWTLGTLSFVAPWALTALIGLPVLWWLLRITPPAPRRLRFPPLRILLNLATREESAAKSPLWLLILRMTIAVLLIFAVADPLFNAVQGLRGQGPLVLVVDNGWASARDWPARQAMMSDLIDESSRAERAVVLMPTAPGPEGRFPAVDLLSADEARTRAEAIRPRPWPTDRAGALESLRAGAALAEAPAGDVVWLGDGLVEGDTYDFVSGLRMFGPLRVLREGPGHLVALLKPPVADGDDLIASATRPTGRGEAEIWIRAYGDDGTLLARQSTRFEAGDLETALTLSLPSELRNRLARLEIEDQTTAGAVALLDERWRRRPVGLVTAERNADPQPLLSEFYYVHKALQPFTEVRRGPIEELLSRELAVIVIADMSPLSDADRARIAGWIGEGGVALRFAGPRLAEGAANTDPQALLPVMLRDGGRTLGGALSWQEPATLAPFEPASPFHGLAVPEDVTVERQVLALPSLDLAEKTWARLSDGTPLVTAEKSGRGWLILVHTMANSDWSNLPISGLFVDMLRRIVTLSQGAVASPDATPLPPVEVLDGFGRLGPAPADTLAISGDVFTETRVSAVNPPGYYGQEDARRALNLAPQLDELRPLPSMPSGVEVSGYDKAPELSLKPWLLAAAFLLALLDYVASLAMRGLLRFRPSVAAGAAILAVVLFSGAAQAQSLDQLGGDQFALEASLTTRLAFVASGDDDIDSVSRAGLHGLSVIVNRRTAVELGPPVGIDPETDELLFFPLLYWPVTEQGAPSPDAVARLREYLAAGGMILFDTRDPNGAVSMNALRDLADSLELPPLVPVDSEHVLTRSYYLMRDFPGRWTGSLLWVEQAGERVNDGVSTVVAGSHDWAGAWAMDEYQRHMFAVVPGGERQREMAYRFGINLIMYALTGNYKADQVHLPAILERLGL